MIYKKNRHFWRFLNCGWGGWIRTNEWRYQKPLPYHLATPQRKEFERSVQKTQILCYIYAKFFLLARVFCKENKKFLYFEQKSDLLWQADINPALRLVMLWKEGSTRNSEYRLYKPKENLWKIFWKNKQRFEAKSFRVNKEKKFWESCIRAGIVRRKINSRSQNDIVWISGIIKRKLRKIFLFQGGGI